MIVQIVGLLVVVLFVVATIIHWRRVGPLEDGYDKAQSSYLQNKDDDIIRPEDRNAIDALQAPVKAKLATWDSRFYWSANLAGVGLAIFAFLHFASGGMFFTGLFSAVGIFLFWFTWWLMWPLRRNDQHAGMYLVTPLVAQFPFVAGAACSFIAFLLFLHAHLRWH